MVKGASRLAASLGVAPLVIGLTVVAYGTSAPELAVSLQSSFNGEAELALGNVIGSNIFNVLVVLGLSAVITPLVVAQQLVRLDVPIMIGVSGLMLLLGRDGDLSRLDGLLLFMGGIVYTGFLFYQGRQEPDAVVQAEYAPYIPPEAKPGWQKWLINLALLGIGLTGLVIGSRLLVTGAVSIAVAFGVSQLVIGLTIVATGTSLPEVVTSLVASLRGERDIAVGNVVGSNIFNVLVVLGLTSALSPDGMAVSDSALQFNGPVMLAVAIACFPIFFTGNRVSRWEGAMMFSYYVAYVVYILREATVQSDDIVFEAVIGGFVVPLTVLTLLIGAWRFLRAGRSHRSRAKSDQER